MTDVKTKNNEEEKEGRMWKNWRREECEEKVKII